jgi:hypothetical protein
MKTKSKILDREFEYSVTHGALRVDEKALWLHDLWLVCLEGQQFEYSTGIAHRKRKPSFCGYDEYKRVMRRNPLQTFENLMKYKESVDRVTKPKAPALDDVLWALLLDATDTDLPFEEWCWSVGASEDSISDLDTYQACTKNRKKLQKVLNNHKIFLDEAIEAFQDY